MNKCLFLSAILWVPSFSTASNIDADSVFSSSQSDVSNEYENLSNQSFDSASSDDSVTTINSSDESPKAILPGFDIGDNTFLGVAQNINSIRLLVFIISKVNENAVNQMMPNDFVEESEPFNQFEKNKERDRIYYADYSDQKSDIYDQQINLTNANILNRENESFSNVRSSAFSARRRGNLNSGRDLSNDQLESNNHLSQDPWWRFWHSNNPKDVVAFVGSDISYELIDKFNLHNARNAKLVVFGKSLRSIKQGEQVVSDSAVPLFIQYYDGDVFYYLNGSEEDYCDFDIRLGLINTIGKKNIFTLEEVVNLYHSLENMQRTLNVEAKIIKFIDGKDSPFVLVETSQVEALNYLGLVNQSYSAPVRDVNEQVNVNPRSDQLSKDEKSDATKAEISAERKLEIIQCIFDDNTDELGKLLAIGKPFVVWTYSRRYLILSNGQFVDIFEFPPFEFELGKQLKCYSFKDRVLNDNNTNNNHILDKYLNKGFVAYKYSSQYSQFPDSYAVVNISADALVSKSIDNKQVKNKLSPEQEQQKQQIQKRWLQNLPQVKIEKNNKKVDKNSKLDIPVGEIYSYVADIFYKQESKLPDGRIETKYVYPERWDFIGLSNKGVFIGDSDVFALAYYEPDPRMMFASSWSMTQLFEKHSVLDDQTVFSYVQDHGWKIVKRDDKSVVIVVDPFAQPFDYSAIEEELKNQQPVQLSDISDSPANEISEQQKQRQYWADLLQAKIKLINTTIKAANAANRISADMLPNIPNGEFYSYLLSDGATSRLIYQGGLDNKGYKLDWIGIDIPIDRINRWIEHGFTGVSALCRKNVFFEAKKELNNKSIYDLAQENGWEVLKYNDYSVIIIVPSKLSNSQLQAVEEILEKQNQDEYWAQLPQADVELIDKTFDAEKKEQPLTGKLKVPNGTFRSYKGFEVFQGDSKNEGTVLHWLGDVVQISSFDEWADVAVAPILCERENFFNKHQELNGKSIYELVMQNKLKVLKHNPQSVIIFAEQSVD